MVLLQSEAIKSVTLQPDGSRPGSVKCVGHFGSISADGTQSDCSLKAECDTGPALSPQPEQVPLPASREQSGAAGKKRGR